MIYNETDANKNWKTKKLVQLGEFKRGKSKHRPRNDEILFTNGKYPLIQTGEVKAANLYIDSHSAMYNEFGLKQSKLWDAGTLCITIAANIAETGVLKYPMCFPDSVVGFIANKEETTELFMHYVFSFIKKSIQDSVNGSIQDNIDIDYLSGLSFKMPNLPHQEKIVSLLASLDKKIEVNNKLYDLLDEEIMLVYNKWFLQYDYPDTYKKSSVNELVLDSKMNIMIPKTWKTVELGSYIHFVKGISYTSEEIKEGNGLPMINLASIDANSKYRPEEMKYFSGRVQEEKLVKKGDMLIACTDLTRNADIIGCPIFGKR